jgi:hypothetical protein
MDNKQFDLLTKKLDSITSLLAYNLVKDKSVSEQIEILTKSGLKVSEIALLLDKTENQVYVTQTTLRKKKKESKQDIFEQKEDQNV